MNRRPRMGYGRFLLLALVAALLVPTTGCTTLLFTMAYLIKGTNLPAEFPKLKEKKVVVVCRQVTALQYRNGRVDQELAEQVSTLLGQHVPKIKMIPQRKVAEWMDENGWEEYTEVGKALNADMVVGIDLEHFELLQGQTLYQGRANVVVRVYDCKTGELAFKRKPPQAVYPPNRVISTSEKQEYEFRREFVGILSERVARYFYEYDAYSDVALDARSMD